MALMSIQVLVQVKVFDVHIPNFTTSKVQQRAQCIIFSSPALCHQVLKLGYKMVILVGSLVSLLW